MYQAGVYLCVHILVIKVYRKTSMFKLEFRLKFGILEFGEREALVITK
jgi:hypothetical protein